MPIAEIITIGTELLLGEIVDTNAQYIARCLREHGIDVFRTTSIGDNEERIAEAIRFALQSADIIITTGGLGPTIDDPTREAVALAFDEATEFRPELWGQVIERFARFDRTPSENNRRQAYVPQSAIAIENPVGTAPAFMMVSGSRVVVSLPGVPREMEHLLTNAVIPDLQARFTVNAITHVRLLHTTGMGESRIDELIGDLETLSNPTIGLAAHSGQVDVRITAKAPTKQAARAMIRPIENDLRQRLGHRVYGADEDTLASVAVKTLESHGWSLVVLEAGLGGRLLAEMPQRESPFKNGQLVPQPPEDPGQLVEMAKTAAAVFHAKVALGVALYPGVKSEIYLALVTPREEKFLRVPYGGPQKLAPQRAANLGLDLLRKL